MTPSPAELRQWLVRRLARAIDAAASRIDTVVPLADYGLDSATLLELAGELEGWLGRRLPATLLWEAPTIEDIVDLLTRSVPEARTDVEIELEADRSAVAIVGMNCRFPGAESPEELWSLLVEERDAVGTVRDWRAAVLGDKPGGYIGGVELFDAELFGINPREAARMDPQQRLLLEVAWGAFERAGIPPASVAGGSGGVFVGISTYDYAELAGRVDGGVDLYVATGNSHSVAANRLSYVFDLRGPSIAVDTACSSSLTALHVAVQSLRRRECELALVGAVNLILSTRLHDALGHAGALSPTGRCRPFAAAADGYVRGEGCGVVVVKRLADAIEAGDPILAVVLGTALAQDGRSNGLTAPSVLAQETVIRAALADARLAPADVSYVEAHGTGTPLGDPIEFEALRRVFDQHLPEERCGVGSIKSNIGHLEASAGIAGLMKVVLALERGVIPATIHLDEPNRRLALDGSPLQLCSRTIPWPTGQSSVGGVSSFGFGGTNAHVVVGPAPVVRTCDDDARPHVLPLSARSPALLHGLAARVRERVMSYPENVADLCATLGTGRPNHGVRAAATVTSHADVVEALVAIVPVTATRSLRPAFVFGGHGSQYVGMGRQLFGEEPAFRAAIEACELAAAGCLDLPLTEALFSNDSPIGSVLADRGFEARYTQPSLFAVQYGLARLLAAWGIEPAVVLGHSLGEYAAACVAGALPLDAAIALVAERGRLMDELPATASMLHVSAPAEDLKPFLVRAETVTVSCVNGPTSTVLAGPRQDLAAVAAQLEATRIEARLINVPPSHSAWVDPILESFGAHAAALRPCAPRVPYVSGFTGRLVEGDRDLDASYWQAHLRGAVRFRDALREVSRMGHDVVVELDPHPIARAVAATGNGAMTWIPLLRRGEDCRQTLLKAVGQLWERGADVDWRAVEGRSSTRRIPNLPASPQDRKTHWVATSASPDFSENAQPSGVNGDAAPSLVYRTDWRRTTVDEAAGAESGLWIAVGKGGGLGAVLSGSLRARGHQYHELPASVVSDAEFASALASIEAESGAPATGIVYLGGLELEEPVDRPLRTSRLAAACDDVRRLVLAVGALSEHRRPKVYVVTAGAEPCPDGQVARRPVQAALRAFARVAGLEHPAVWGGLVDIELEPCAANDAALADALLATGSESEVCVRAGLLYAPRLVAARTGFHARLSCRPEATYLIVGGLGSVGLRTAEHLVARGARRIVLTGRRGLPPRDQWAQVSDPLVAERTRAVEALEARGATIVPLALDLRHDEALANLLARVAADLPPIRGIVFSAGDIEIQRLADVDLEAIADGLAVKVNGAWALCRYARTLDLDFLVVYSSGAAVWGSALLGPYAAANAFAGAAAAAARAAGQPAFVVHWGLWEGGGLADGAGGGGALQAIGLRPMRAAAALQALDELIAHGSLTEATVADADWGTFRAVYEAGSSARRLLTDLGPSTPPGAGTSKRSSGTRAGTVRSAVDPDVMQHLRSLVARALGHRDEAIDPHQALLELGLDSVCAVDVKAAIDVKFGVDVALSDLLGDHTVASLAEAVERLLSSDADAVSLIDEVSGFSEEELDEILHTEARITQSGTEG